MKKLFSLFAALTLSMGLWATNTTVADLAALQAALSTEVDTVYVSQTISLTDGTNLDAQGKVISVPKPYMAEMGMIAEECSNYSVFNIEGSVSIANATILGGNGDKDSSAGGINVKGGASLTMENVTIARSYRGLYIKSGCTAILKNCNIVRNVCDYGGGILLGGGNKLIMDGCSLSENRSLSRGGGAMEIQSGAVLYANNTVIANNSSSEIGGAINLNKGTAYLTNCTVSGNTNQTSYGAKAGAGIGNNGGTLYAANCIFMNNTFFAPGTEEPTSSDIGLFKGNGNHLINCIYGAVAGGDLATATNCKVASSTDAVFADYRQDGVFRLTDAQTPGFKHSILARKEGGDVFSFYAPAQQFSGTGGVATYVDFSDVNNVKMAYYNGDAITSLGELSADGLTDANKVTTYYEPGTRAEGVIGASAVDTPTYYTVKLVINEHVSVKGVTIYGESYPAGTIVPISHTTEEGFYFHGWNLDMAGTPKYGTGNPYNLTVNSDINVYPQVALEGAYSIFVDLPNKDYVFDVTSGSAKPINENGYAENTEVTIKSARSGYVIEKWIDYAGNELSTDDPFVLTIDGDKHITPVWTPDPNEVTIEINTSEQCTISGLPEGGTCPKGTLITITAEPAIGYQFSYWEDAGGNTISTDNPLVIVATQDENITCYPIFQAEQRTFEIATGVNARMGTLNKNLPWIKTTAKPGLAYMSTTGHDDQDSRDTLIITPEEGVSYRVKFDYAVSSEKRYDTLSIWVNNVRIAEKISGEESGSYDSGVTLLTGLTTIVMSYGKDGDWGDGDDRGYIYNIKVQVYDTPPTIYTVTIPDSEGSFVSGLAPQGKYFSGEEVSLTATPDIGYELKEWQDGNGNQISTSNPLSFTITQDTTIKPIFQTEQRSFEIATGVNAQMGTLNKDYPWVKTTKKPGLAYMSSNYHVEYSDSRDTLIITPEEGISYRVKFDYAVSSDYNYLSIWVNNELYPDWENSGSYDSGETLLTGPTTFVMSYYNYGEWWGEGDDRGYIYNIYVSTFDTIRDTTTVNLRYQQTYNTRLQTVTPTQDTVVRDTISLARKDTTVANIVFFDSIYVYNLKVWPNVVDLATKKDTAFADTLPYHWATYTGKTIECYTIGTYRDTAKNILGTDSIRYTLELEVIAHDTIEVETSHNLLYQQLFTTRLREVQPTTSTIIRDTIRNVLVSPLQVNDTIYIYNLHVWPQTIDLDVKKDTALVDTLPYHWATYTGKTIECYTAGTYRDTAKNILGTDSIRYTLEFAVILRDTVTESVSAKLCYQQVFKSRLQTVTPMQDTTFNDTVKNIVYQDCLLRDSIYVYNLTVLPAVDIKDAMNGKVCYNTAYTWELPEGNRTIAGYTTAGVKTLYDTVRNSLDCDSIIYTLNLTVLPDVDIKDAESDKVCYNTEYTWVLPEGNRTIDGYTVAGVKTLYDTVRNSLDCDSIIYTLNLTVLPDVVPQVYTRTVTNSDWGTICLPWESVALEGGTFYDVLGTKDAEQGVALVELGESDQLTAGKPYVFLATSEQIKVTYYPSTEVEDEVAGNNIIGSFDGCNVPEGKYIIVNNLLYKTADATSTIAANCAYFDVDAMGEYTPSQALGRNVVFMGGKTIPTGEWGIENGEMKMNGKYIMNGQFVIVRNGKMYNALGM